jgi:hypothetical protein
MGPFMVILYGMGLVALPEAARVLNRSPRHLTLFCVLLSVGLTLPALAWGVALLVMLPRGVGAGLLGPLWLPTYPLVLPTTLSSWACAPALALAHGPARSGAARRSLRAAAPHVGHLRRRCPDRGRDRRCSGDDARAALRHGRRAAVLVAAACGASGVRQRTSRNRLWFRHRAARHRNRGSALMYRRKPDARPRRGWTRATSGSPTARSRLRSWKQFCASAGTARSRGPVADAAGPLVQQRRAYPQPRQPPRLAKVTMHERHA